MRSCDVFDISAREVVVFDGAMGTMLQQAGLPADKPPELWNIEAPETVLEIHRSYVEAGAQIITTNTFGASRLKLAQYGLSGRQGEIISAAVDLARRAAAQKAAVAGDIGPIGVFLQPFGELSFDEAVREFRLWAEHLIKAGVDFILLETFTDVVELKAAVLGCLAAGSAPIAATFSFDEGDRSVTGTPPEVFALTANNLPTKAFGTNCGAGIKPVVAAVERMAPLTEKPIIAQPNAGRPKVVGGKTVFPATPEQMADAALALREAGANIIGACCGSSPEHIARIADAVRGKPVKARSRATGFWTASRTRLLRIAYDEPVALVGERINPSGRRRFREKLAAGDLSAVKLEAVEQRSAHALDVCVAAPEVDEEKILPKAVAAVTTVSEAPIFIDTTNPEALEEALKVCPGVPVINSVSGREASLSDVLPLAAKYGACIVALAMDDDGVPDDPDKRTKVIEKIISRAQELGIDGSRVIADPVMLPVSAAPDAVEVTLRALDALRKAGIPTILGLSNVSYGLPWRSQVNAAMAAAAVMKGLCAVITDPNDHIVAQTIAAAQLLAGRDPKGKALSDLTAETHTQHTHTQSLWEDIVHGNAELVGEHIPAELEGRGDPLKVIDEVVIPAIRHVGELYDRREVFLPQLIASAEATAKALDILRGMLPPGAGSRGRVLLATVRGDVHDIGKNLVRAVLQSHGFEVVDMGKSVPASRIVEELAAGKYIAVGLSALMTTTLPSLEATVEKIRERFPELPVIVGGAAVTAEFAERIGAIYAKDALAAAKILCKLANKA